jgi:hypothetical protein
MFHAWGWHTVPCEPATFFIKQGNEWARMIANTDDFAVFASTQNYLDQIRAPFEKEWKITIQRFTPEMSIIQHAGLKIQNLPNGSISMTNPKAIQNILQAQGLQDCNPAPTPHIAGMTWALRNPTKRLIDVTTYKSILGSCRFLADTTHPEIAYITGIAGQHAHNPTARHMLAVKRILQYCSEVRDRVIGNATWSMTPSGHFV